MTVMERILIIGGSSGIGLEVARQTLDAGASVVIAGRSRERLEKARQEIGRRQVETISVDIGNMTQVEKLFAQTGKLDHLIITAADLPYGSILELREQDLMRAVRSKFLGPIFVVQEATKHLRPKGSITLTSGIAALRPIRGGATAASINGAIEGLTRALAIELAPFRINAVSPGWTDTPIWDTMSGITAEKKKERFSEMAGKLPVGRIGRANEIAEGFLFLMKNEFITGTVLHVDGGHPLI